MLEQNSEARSLTPGFPSYSKARHFLRIVDGVSYPLYRSMYNLIWEQRGNPQEIVNWVNPDEWITERLSGDERELALHFWHDSNHELNPRYLRGKWYLVSKHGLLAKDENELLIVTERGRNFLRHTESAIAAEIDEYEGVLRILQIVAEKGPGWRSEFLNDYTSYCLEFTTYRSETVIKGSLYDRLVNLTERGFVNRKGLTYEIADAGLAYLDKYAHLLKRNVSVKQSQVVRQAREISKEAREQLYNYLLELNPFKFEELIKFLLEEMGYTEVEVTSPTNDKGVDVVGNIELGISQVREVIQVKRLNHNRNVQREVLDKLRGVLHRFDAVRGTIITTGGFAKGTSKAAFERGAAPITLIDGEKLLDLLTEYNIGVTKKSVEYIEFDPSKLAQFETRDADQPAE